MKHLKRGGGGMKKITTWDIPLLPPLGFQPYAPTTGTSPQCAPPIYCQAYIREKCERTFHLRSFVKTM